MIFRNIHSGTCRAWLSRVSLRQELCFFSSVPPQPVPPLAQTLQGYLRALEPLLPLEELSHTRRIVHDFGRPGGLGTQLQEGLEKRARLNKNWVCSRVAEGERINEKSIGDSHTSPSESVN
ncbi:carnitine O-acetyltransferase-like [Pundamilia nyererei]|uniref:Carnitine O-acetyltransferase-like n=1 Tax=Pundamilia nyererei TaxID=303518 RepID=A0A9Y6J592_9CICH|nr:PREDICTED: carnitine O-acetyltransferase-like [Pundamilia nyererei]